jgi:hypothetical protein
LDDMITRRCLRGDVHKEVLVKEVLVKRCAKGGACEKMLEKDMFMRGRS